MKDLFAKGLLLSSCIAFMGIFHWSNTKSQEEVKRLLVEDIEQKTVALVTADEDGNLAAYCTGVWIGRDKILTAHHCLRDDEFVVYQDVQNIIDDTIGRVAYVQDVEPENDLALLMTVAQSTPQHPVAALSSEVWDGQHVNIVGHTNGLWWSYIEGVISSTRTNIFTRRGKMPRTLQISSPAWFGNSGGGAFNDAGELVGMTSWISTRAPMMSFFVHRDVIEKFLTKNHTGH